MRETLAALTDDELLEVIQQGASQSRVLEHETSEIAQTTVDSDEEEIDELMR